MSAAVDKSTSSKSSKGKKSAKTARAPNAVDPAPVAAETPSRSAPPSSGAGGFQLPGPLDERLRVPIRNLLASPSIPRPLLNAFEQFETKTGKPRELLGLVVLAFVALYLVVGGAAAVLCNLIGFVYPAVQSVKALRSVRKDDDQQWLTYWTVFGSFLFFDYPLESLLAYLPIYFLAKSIFLCWLFLPSTLGAQILYVRAVEPVVKLAEKTLGGSFVNANIGVKTT